MFRYCYGFLTFGGIIRENSVCANLSTLTCQVAFAEYFLSNARLLNNEQDFHDLFRVSKKLVPLSRSPKPELNQVLVKYYARVSQGK